MKNWGNYEDVITVRDCQDIAKVLEFRQIVEPEACYLAVRRGNTELIPELKYYLDEMKKNFGHKASFVQADISFHEAICRAADNPLLAKSMSRVFRETKSYHEKMNDIFGYQEGMRYHARILQAIQDKDAILAKELMYEHMQNAIDTL